MSSDRERYGYVKIEIESMLLKSELSKSKFKHRAELQNQQYKMYLDGSIERLDVCVLARICSVLDCSVEDILIYVPPTRK